MSAMILLAGVSVPTTTWALIRTGDRKPDGGPAGRDK
jgi:hypothetical protein